MYLMARAMPRVGEEKQAIPQSGSAMRILNRVFIERIDRLFGETLEKTLRRVKVFVLKIEGAISRSLERKRKFAGEITKKSEQSAALFEIKNEEEK